MTAADGRADGQRRAAAHLRKKKALVAHRDGTPKCAGVVDGREGGHLFLSSSSSSSRLRRSAAACRWLVGPLFPSMYYLLCPPVRRQCFDSRACSRRARALPPSRFITSSSPRRAKRKRSEGMNAWTLWDDRTAKECG